MLEKRSSEQIARLADFYDYYEIQPVGNNRFMIESDKIPDVTSEEDLRNLNRQIVELGEKFKKPVVATCDVHFLDPEDEVYRRIIMAGKGFDDAVYSAATVPADDGGDAGRICLSWIREGAGDRDRQPEQDRENGGEDLAGKSQQMSSGH